MGNQTLRESQVHSPVRHINSATPFARIDLVDKSINDSYSRVLTNRSKFDEERRIKKDETNNDLYEVKIQDDTYVWDTK